MQLSTGIGLPPQPRLRETRRRSGHQRRVTSRKIGASFGGGFWAWSKAPSISPVAYSSEPREQRLPKKAAELAVSACQLLAHSCRGVRRNACPFAEKLRSLPASGDIGAASDGRRDRRPHAVGYFGDGPSASPSRVFTLPMTAWPPSPMRICSTRTYRSVPWRRRRWT